MYPCISSCYVITAVMLQLTCVLIQPAACCFGLSNLLRDEKMGNCSLSNLALLLFCLKDGEQGAWQFVGKQKYCV